MLPFIEESDSIREGIEKNRDHALNLAVLLNYHKLECSLEDIYLSICSFSYKGDVRMKFKMENPNKVKNIVSGSRDGLDQLYKPRLTELQKMGIVTLNEDGNGV